MFQHYISLICPFRIGNIRQINSPSAPERTLIKTSNNVLIKHHRRVHDKNFDWRPAQARVGAFTNVSEAQGGEGHDIGTRNLAVGLITPSQPNTNISA